MLISNQQNKQDGPLDWLFGLFSDGWDFLLSIGGAYIDFWRNIWGWVIDNIIPNWIKVGFSTLANWWKIVFIVAVVGLTLKFIKVI